MKKLLLSLLAGLALMCCTAVTPAVDKNSASKQPVEQRHQYTCYHVMFGAAFITLIAVFINHKHAFKK